MLPASATVGTSSFGDDIQTVMSILRAVKSSEISEFTRDFRAVKKCMSENSIDIALVQETYLKPNRPKACSIAGYVQLRTDRAYSSKGVPLCTTDAPTLRPY
ncbi:hypothetical protein EVAR_3277_1 [Eumeta japonica]|uniref:Uncharacterized protein n=1 Tax=Eumeta variegata TaxID=151549 RepID=A0A4C1SXP0_EUMVA|nr:hypothetical protein EVAR_3277_1 [Eumeta japonica]